MSDPLLEVEQVQRLSLQPGDVIIVKVAATVSAGVADQIRRTIEAKIPGHNVLLVRGDVQLAAIAEDDVASIRAAVEQAIANPGHTVA